MAKIALTNHVIYRLLERGIDTHDVRRIAVDGSMVSSEEDGIIKREGKSSNARKLIVVAKANPKETIIITAYYGD